MQGKGEQYFKNMNPPKVCYRGDFEDGNRSGHGTSFYENGNIHYIGTWKSDLHHGNGKVYGNSNGFKYLKTESSENVTESGQVCIKSGIFKNGKFIRKSEDIDDDLQFGPESNSSESNENF